MCTRAENVSHIHISNVVVKWLILLLHILEVSGSNIGPETGYPD
jgi:hypothetical protein